MTAIELFLGEAPNLARNPWGVLNLYENWAKSQIPLCCSEIWRKKLRATVSEIQDVRLKIYIILGFEKKMNPLALKNYNTWLKKKYIEAVTEEEKASYQQEADFMKDVYMSGLRELGFPVK